MDKSRVKALVDEINSLSEIINDLDFPSSHRIVGAQIYNCIIHCQAVSILIQPGLYSPAYSLIRVIVESYISARWLLDLCQEGDREKYARGKKQIKIYETICNIKRIDPDVGQWLLEIWQSYGNAMHSYTHAGGLPLQRLIGEDYIGWEPDDDEILGVLTMVKIFIILSVAKIADLVHNERKGELFQKISPYIESDMFKN